MKSEVVKKTLGYYLINPKARHYARELAMILKLDPGNLYRKLVEMQAEGILNTESEGRNRYFSLNEKFPLLSEYQKIYQAKFGVSQSLASVLKPISGLKSAYIFGSCAKGNFEPASDIDLLLVGEFDYGQASKALAVLEKDWRREINIVDMSSKEFDSKLKKKDDFLMNILKGKYIKVV